MKPPLPSMPRLLQQAPCDNSACSQGLPTCASGLRQPHVWHLTHRKPLPVLPPPPHTPSPADLPPSLLFSLPALPPSLQRPVLPIT